AQCHILRCNSEFVAATLELGGGPGGAGGRGTAPYCSALRSYALCTRRTARGCRGNLAYHSAVQGIEDLLIQNRCPKTGPTAPPRPPPVPLQRRRRTEPVSCISAAIVPLKVDSQWPSCGGQLQLCPRSRSAGRSFPPTHLSLPLCAPAQITVIFRSSPECTEQQTYQARLGDVPAAFVDGSSAAGERRGGPSLGIRSLAPGQHAEIRAAHIGTTLVVRQSGRSLSLAVRAPREDLQLCVWGCPASQRLAPPAPPASALAARAHCARQLPAEDVYFQACVFDLLVTGNASAAAAAVAALEDARAMVADPEKVHLLPSAAARPQIPALLLLAAALWA
ncbi:RGMA protein, partial [Atractosteus spatula]|nr:RGMA protein [Atractosteus spatula]